MQMDGCKDQFWRLTKPEHLRARAFCRKLMGNREDGDDLYQDALVSALTRFESLRDNAAFRPWLYRIVINSFHNRMRKRWWKCFVPLTQEIAETVSGDNPLPALNARNRLKVAMAAVKPEDRALVTLFELEGWSIAELARMNGLSQGAIKVRLSRTRQKMREALAAPGIKAGKQKTKNTKLSEEAICVAARSGTD